MALLSTVHKFRTRFAFIEQQLQQQHKNIEQVSLAEIGSVVGAGKTTIKMTE